MLIIQSVDDHGQAYIIMKRRMNTLSMCVLLLLEKRHNGYAYSIYYEIVQMKKKTDH